MESIRQCHDRHFPWCDKYDKDIRCHEDMITDVAKGEVTESLVPTIVEEHAHTNHVHYVYR